MNAVALARPLSSVAWELRAAWAKGLRVALSLERCDLDRVEGIVTRVAATDAYCTVRGLRVPLDRILAVHRPSLLGDSTARAGTAAAGRPAALVRYHCTGQQTLAMEDR